MFYVVEYIKLGRVVSRDKPRQSYDTALSIFDRIKKSGVVEARMVKVEHDTRTVLKYVNRRRQGESAF